MSHRVKAANNLKTKHFFEHLLCARSRAWESSAEEEEVLLPVEKTNTDNSTSLEESCNRGQWKKLSCCAGLFFSVCELFHNQKPTTGARGTEGVAMFGKLESLHRGGDF